MFDACLAYVAIVAVIGVIYVLRLNWR